jgi:hypothetical protein
VVELLDAGGLSDEKLLAIHANYLGLCISENPQLKALGLKALDMAYKLKGAYAPERHRIEAVPPVPVDALEQMTRVLREMHEVEAEAEGTSRVPPETLVCVPILQLVDIAIWLAIHGTRAGRIGIGGGLPPT